MERSDRHVNAVNLNARVASQAIDSVAERRSKRRDQAKNESTRLG